eukprot:5583582-Alexandrium_andersonii.AAC.1
MSASLVGSEMCIRDSSLSVLDWAGPLGADPPRELGKVPRLSRNTGATGSSGDELVDVVGAEPEALKEDCGNVQEPALARGRHAVKVAPAPDLALEL